MACLPSRPYTSFSWSGMAPSGRLVTREWFLVETFDGGDGSAFCKTWRNAQGPFSLATGLVGR